MKTSASVTEDAPSTRHVLVMGVDNEPGALARIVGLISGRGYNIESLTVSTVSEDQSLSRVNLVTRGDAMIIEQIKAQLLRLVPVRSVQDLALSKSHIEKESFLVRIVASGTERQEALRIATVFKAAVIDTTLESFVFFLTGSSAKLDSFVLLMQALGQTEIARSGIIAMARGNKLMQ